MKQEQRITISSSHGDHGIPVVSVTGHAVLSSGRPCVILCHGLSSDKDGYLGFYKIIADRLFENGIDSVRFDFRGHGESEIGPQGFTVASQIQDLADVYTWCKEHYPHSEIRLFGSSFGAFPCIFLSTLYREIKNLYLLAPVLDYERTFIKPVTPWGIESFTNLCARSLIGKEPVYITDTLYMAPELVFEIATIAIENTIRNCRANLAVMHGDSDGMVPYEISRSLAEKYPHINFHTFENMDHGFTDKDDPDGSSDATRQNIEKIVAIVTS